MTSDKRFDVLLWQYRECLSFIRSYNSLIWQTPSITMAINTFLGILYLGYAKTLEARIMVLLASLTFTFAATVALEKHRFFQEAKGDEFRRIQNELLKEVENVKELKLRTRDIFCSSKEDYPTITRNPIVLLPAYRLLLSIMCGTIVVMITLITAEVLHL